MNSELLYLSQQNIADLRLSPERMLELTTDVLIEKQSRETEMPPKIGVHPRGSSFLHAMPGYLKKQDSVGLKLVSYYPDNGTTGQPTINAMMLLNDAATGLPLAVMDGNWITAYRTAAVSTLSCRLLTRRAPRTLGIIGYGVQAQSHIELLAATFELDDIQIWGPSPERCRSFAERTNDYLRPDVKAVASAEQAVRDKDLVISVTPIGVDPAQRLLHDWLAPGAVVCPVEFDCAWDKKTFQQADLFVTDDIAQFDQYRLKGFFKDIPTPGFDLADLVGPQAPSIRDDNIAVAVNLGVGLMDIAFARELYELARRSDAGTRLPR